LKELHLIYESILDKKKEKMYDYYDHSKNKNNKNKHKSNCVAIRSVAN
jgi:hypothetical protein